MNTAFKQWYEEQYLSDYWNVCYQIWHYLKQNPHLLREDGESIPLSHIAPDIAFSNPRPTDPVSNDWGKVAKSVAEKIIPQFWHCPTEYKKEVLAALTEIAELAYDRGREEERDSYKARIDLYDRSIKNLKETAQQQLAEKDEFGKRKYDAGFVECSRILGKQVESLQSELAAAKAEVERLKNENGNLELALKNL